MALSRRSGDRYSAAIWPGFVDAMTALLLVLMFVLTIFMVVQFVLSETIDDQDIQLDSLSLQVADLAEALGLESVRADGLEEEVGRLGGELENAADTAATQSALIASLTQQSADQAAVIDNYELEVSGFEAQVASLLAERSELALNNSALTARAEEGEADNARLAAQISEAEAQNLRNVSEQEALQLALAAARDEIDEGVEAARLAAAQREALEAMIADAQSGEETTSLTLQAALASLESSQTDLGTVRGTLVALEADVIRLEGELAAQVAEGGSLRVELADIEARFSASERKRRAGELSAVRMRAQLEALNANLNVEESDSAQRAEESDFLRIQLGEAEEALTEAEAARLKAVEAAATLRQRLAEAEGALTDEEKTRLAEAAAAAALRARLADTEGALSAEETAKLAEMAAAESLREKLKNSQDELTAMTLALEEQRQKAEDTLTILAAAESAKKDVDALLAAALLAQQEQTAALQEQADALAASGSERDSANDEMNAALARIKIVEDEKQTLSDRLAAVVAQLEADESEGSQLLAEANRTRLDLEARLKEALAAKLIAEQERTNNLTRAQERDVLLAQANSLLSDEKARSAESDRALALLNQQTEALRNQLQNLQALLDDSHDRDAAAKVQIELLGSNLNAALAQAAADQRRRAELEAEERKRVEAEAKTLEAEAKNLEKFKSEFFGQLRDLLGTQEGVRIVGDRFVFASEVLFPAGSTQLSTEGQAEITKVALLIKQIADQIPTEIDWILRVDGHTDDRPMGGGGKYADNWELSQGRALSVVRYMIDFLGIPSDRLAATGFGEFQPVNTDDTDEARAQNRRIEMKFTEK